MISVAVKRKSFGAQTVLQDVNFDIATDERVSIVGPSGVGKSTLLRLIAELDRDYEGQISTVKNSAVVFQEPTLLNWRDVMDNLRITTRKDDRTLENILAEVGLSDKSDMFPSQLSLGQQRRVSLARALAVNPELLILDEPFASLDDEMVDEMLALTKQVVDTRNMALLLVTHTKKEAAFLTDRQLMLGGNPATIIQ
ncbi:ABC transporter ATP-binding protein [Amylibacter kogurei]|uniref:ABC transporter ATP-binding protein n=1 Tax=Paramylibacter kogurei TaxID=1889778 RepID=A0A2G5K6J1_9RHOB|nr:ATP-binding cassette domain-containing protein [Amylibacter kogurei]PIB24623.1 ABC transporter ATP-binding protein [Amylibacter kogurei]